MIPLSFDHISAEPLSTSEVHVAMNIKCRGHLTATQGRNKGTIARAPNYCGHAQKVPTISQVLPSIEYICFRKTSGGSNTGVAKLASCPGRHLTSLHPCSHNFYFTNCTRKSEHQRTSLNWHCTKQQLFYSLTRWRQ